MRGAVYISTVGMDGLRDREQEVWCSLKLSSQLIFLDLVLDKLTQEKECLPVE